MKKVLIVEDEIDLLEIYKMQFEASGMEVAIANNLKQGVALAKKWKPDVILLDILLSQKEIGEKTDKRGGYILLNQLKADPAAKNIKIIVFSNMDTQVDRDLALQKGACAYLIKSEIVPRDLVKIVKQQCA